MASFLLQNDALSKFLLNDGTSRILLNGAIVPQGGASGYLTPVRKYKHGNFTELDLRATRQMEKAAGITSDDDELALLLILHELL